MRILTFIILSIIFVAVNISGRDRHKQSKTASKIEQYPVNTAICDSESICFKPIGYFKTPFDEKTGAPRHGILQPKTKGEIEILPKYRDALAMLEKFEYIIVLYYFNSTENWESIVGHLSVHKKFGVFASRTPKRPNPIGMSVVKVDSLKDGTLYLAGIDAFNNTPVLDIKPYLPSVDVINSRKNREVEYLFKTPYGKRIKDPKIYK